MLILKESHVIRTKSVSTGKAGWVMVKFSDFFFTQVPIEGRLWSYIP